MTAYLIAALPWIVGGTYVLTLVLVLRARQYWAFPAYLAAEFISLCVYEPGRMWVILYVDPVVLVLQVAAAIEAWMYVTWCFPTAGERIRTLLLSVAIGAIGAVALMYQWSPEHMTIPEWFGEWPPDPRVFLANQGRLTVHLIAVATAFVPALRELTHPARRVLQGARAHSWTMALYGGLFVVWDCRLASCGMGVWLGERDVFRILILLPLVLWCLQAGSTGRRGARLSA